MSESVLERALSRTFRRVNRTRQWYELPLPLAMLNLVALRDDLRSENLYDTRTQVPATNGEPMPERAKRARMPEGHWNDLNEPDMGSLGTEFTRNIAPERIHPERPPRLFDPSPRQVSLELMNRDEFKPATTLNVLAAAWIQFENHNWFFHGRGEPDEIMDVPLADDDPWPDHPMHVRRSIPVPKCEHATDRDSYPNTETHWWDGSQIYGSSEEKQRQLRTFQDGKIKLQPDGRLFPDPEIPGLDLTGFAENWWAGLAVLHTLFTKEHNAICDVLRGEHPSWDDQRLFDTAWLVNSALMAKIHTVEWTPGILAHPVLKIAMNTNWWGLLGERFHRTFGRVSDNEVLSGIPGSPTEHHGAPFQLTEEFVSVYRMHPLIPDDWTFYSLESGEVIDQREFTEIQGEHTRDFLDGKQMCDLLYTMGVEHPGQVCLHNYPRALQNFTRIDGERMDLATLDVLRDRERGVPRYNDFREQMRMPRLRNFEELTSNPKWREDIRRVYRNDIDKVDLQVGMYAEDLIPGFGFSDTAFRIFILMASRRLKSDRFFTSDFRPEVYTQTGLDWVNRNTMKDVLLRHHPELGPALEGVDNAFAPWKRVGVSTNGRGRSGIRVAVGRA